MINEFSYLLTDPRPDLAADSKQWQHLFRLIPTIPNKRSAFQLSTMLWSMRAWGTEIKRDERYRLKFIPYIHPAEGWESEQQFKEISTRHLAPYAETIKQLLGRLR